MEPTIDSMIRTRLNAALTRLAGCWDEDAACLVIQHCDKLPTVGFISYESTKTTQWEDAPVSGYTQEQGDIQMRTSSTETKEKNFGTNKARIGQFRVQKVFDGAIEFQHFLKSGLATMNLDEEPPPRYRLGYDKKTLKPLFLAVWDKKTIFKISFLSTTIVRHFLVPIHGEISGRKWALGIETKTVR